MTETMAGLVIGLCGLYPLSLLLSCSGGHGSCYRNVTYNEFREEWARTYGTQIAFDGRIIR